MMLSKAAFSLGGGQLSFGALARTRARITAKLYFLLSQPSRNCAYVDGRQFVRRVIGTVFVQDRAV